MSFIKTEFDGAGALLLFTNGLAGLQLKDNLDFLIDGWKLATFGGGLERGEDPLECLERELKEELGLDLVKYDCEKIGVYQIVLEDGKVCTNHNYLVKNVPLESLRITEGNLCVFDPFSDISNLKVGLFLQEAITPSLERAREILQAS